MFRPLLKPGLAPVLVYVLLLLGALQVIGAGWIHAKARLAQWLIADAWQESLARGGAPVRPWPWADTWPVARLQVPSLEVDQYVLAGATGNALAFGPGHHSLTAMPGQNGVSMLAGHRDTHFSFLRRLQRGTLVAVEDGAGQTHSYRVSGVRVVDTRSTRLVLPEAGDPRLWLLTCYPFDAVASGGELRYLVSADPVPDREMATAARRHQRLNVNALTAAEKEYQL